MAGDGDGNGLHDALASFVDSDEGLGELAVRLVQRLRCAEYNGYPLQRAVLVLFNRDGRKVTDEFKEVAHILAVRGLGTDAAEAFRDLERQFDQLVREKVRIPPHAHSAADDAVRVVINHLVDWDQFARENPPSRLLWGKIERFTSSGLPMIHWLVGAEGLRNRSAVLPRKFWTPYFGLLAQGDWFRGAAREYRDRVEWDEPPKSCPDPTDPKTRQAAWDAIPRIEADDPDAWPLKRK